MHGTTIIHSRGITAQGTQSCNLVVIAQKFMMVKIVKRLGGGGGLDL